MSRPRKCRKVCHYPDVLGFDPVGTEEKVSPVMMTVDEYETIRLIDKEGFSQEQCREFMNVARTTVQLIYASARRKLADALVEGRPIRITGGDYELCSGGDDSCGDGTCFKNRERYVKTKGDCIMRVAVTYENGQIFQHFGHTETFKVYDVEDNKVVASEVVDTNGQGHGALAGVLNVLKVDVLICGGIGGGAQAALAEAGIQLFGGVSGDADEAVAAYLAGSLAYNPNVRCNHHGEHHHEEGHSCGSHGCGSHHCG